MLGAPDLIPQLVVCSTLRIHHPTASERRTRKVASSRYWIEITFLQNNLLENYDEFVVLSLYKTKTR